MVIPVSARERFMRSRLPQREDAQNMSIAQQSQTGTRAQASRRTQRFQGVTKPSARGRYAASKQQRPVKKSIEQVTPPAGGGTSVSAPTNVGIDPDNWENIRNKLQKAESPSQALEDIKKIEKDFPVISAEQKTFLDMSKLKMELQIIIAQLRHLQSSGQLVGKGSVNKPQQQEAPPAQQLAPPAEGGPSASVVELNPVVQTQQPSVTQMEIDPMTSQPRPVPTPPIQQQVTPVISNKPQPQQQAAQTVLGQMLEYVPSAPNLSSFSTQATQLQPIAQTTQPEPGKHATESGWINLQKRLRKEAESPSQKLVERIEKMKQYQYFNDEQRRWLDEYQKEIEKLFVKEDIWKRIQTDLTKAAITLRSPEVLMERVERIKKDHQLNNEQRKWLEEFEQKYKPLSVSIKPTNSTLNE